VAEQPWPSGKWAVCHAGRAEKKIAPVASGLESIGVEVRVEQRGKDYYVLVPTDAAEWVAALRWLRDNGFYRPIKISG
jgi:hypothetical protein